MNAWTVMKYGRKYSECPECGNDKVGNGEGTLNVDDDTFTRTCKCGWSITLDEKGLAEDA